MNNKISKLYAGIVVLDWGQFCPPPSRHLAMSGDISSHTVGRSAASIELVEATDTAKPLTVHRSAPHHKELSSPKCQ